MIAYALKRELERETDRTIILVMGIHHLDDVVKRIGDLS